MDQHRAVSKMMTTLRMELTDVKLPLWFDALVREKFMQMYAAGYDQRRMDDNQSQTIKIIQYSCTTGDPVSKYNSIREAERISGYLHSGIIRSVATGKPYRGYYWRQAPLEELQNAQRDHHMY